MIATRNPATGEILQTFSPLSDREIARKVQQAADAFEKCRRVGLAERSRLMIRAAEELDDSREALARLATIEMGKPIQAARDEISKCAWACRYYAENAGRFLASESIDTDGQISQIRYQPIGPVLAIMPWNFPFWQVFRFAAPALMAGNVGLLKHASSVPQCARAIEEIFDRAGFPGGAFQTLLIGSDQVPAIVADQRVAAVTLTGSPGAGSHVASEAGRHLKKTVLELGGSDPFIIMSSADMKAAIDTAVKARIINNGQSCIAAKRMIIAEDIADQFEREFTKRMAELRVGDPMDETTEVGPLATAEVIEALDDQVRRSVAAGARILTGGRRIDRAGYFYQPTVLTDIPQDALYVEMRCSGQLRHCCACVMRRKPFALQMTRPSA